MMEDGTIDYYSVNKEIPNPARDFQSPHNILIDTISKEKGIDPYLVKCVVKVESNFKADAVSVAGAMGLMQLMQEIAREYNVKDPFDPEENLRAGISHLKSLLDYFDNDISLALAAYHAGIGRVKKHMKVPPIESTIKYVNDIMYFYTGNKNNDIETKVRKLYKRINREGVIEIYSK